MSRTPSSHVSRPAIIPSPQVVVQTEGDVGLPPVHNQPGTFPVHDELHLSKLLVSASSQNSSGEINSYLQVEIDPTAPVQVQPSSGPVQSYLHFLLSSVVIPSSQASVPALIPSQHEVTQFEGVEELPPVHDQPSTFPVQRELHLSELLVPPSSQNSVPTTLKSPQIGLQLEAEVELPPEQVHPTTGPEQIALHFEVPSMSPSSHASGKITLLSPHKGEQVEGVFRVPPVQTYPGPGPVQLSKQ